MNLNIKTKYYKSSDIIPVAVLLLTIFFWAVRFHFFLNFDIPLYIIIVSLLVIISVIYFNDIILFELYILVFLVIFIIQLKLFGIHFSNIPRTLIYIPAFSFLIVFLYRNFKSLTPRAVEYFFIASSYLIYAQFITQILQLFLFLMGIRSIPNFTYINYFFNYPRASGFFYEPADLAYSLSPFIFLFIYDYKSYIKRFKKYTAVCLIFIFILSPSATFFVILILALLIRLYKFIRSNLSVTRLIKFFILILLFLSVTIYIFYKNTGLHNRAFQVIDYAASPNLVSTKTNLSVLGFIKGLQMSEKALTKYPLGVGILNMQYLNKFSSVSKLGKFYKRLNEHDGTSLAFKMVSELGYFGLLIIIISFIVLLKNIGNRMSDKRLLETSFIFGLISSYIRCDSYIYGVPIIGLSLIFHNLISLKLKK